MFQWSSVYRVSWEAEWPNWRVSRPDDLLVPIRLFGPVRRKSLISNPRVSVTHRAAGRWTSDQVLSVS